MCLRFVARNLIRIGEHQALEAHNTIGLVRRQHVSRCSCSRELGCCHRLQVALNTSSHLVERETFGEGDLLERCLRWSVQYSHDVAHVTSLVHLVIPGGEFHATLVGNVIPKDTSVRDETLILQAVAHRLKGVLFVDREVGGRRGLTRRVHLADIPPADGPAGNDGDNQNTTN